MRRTEFEIKDKKEISDFLNIEKTALLSLIDDKKPYSIPINFVYFNETVYFHSSVHGKKIDILAKNNNAQITFYREYSFIPSYFTKSQMSCSASQFFKSVIITGKLIKINQTDKVLLIFNELMKKYQPEGNYNKIEINDKMLNNELNCTAVYMLKQENISAKFKFGQNLNEDKIKILTDNLIKRGDPIDLETIKMIKKYRQ